MRILRASTPAALAVAVALVACGGDASRRLTKEEFIARADAICERYNPHVNDVVRRLPPGDQPAGARMMHDEFVPLMRAQVRELRALRPPAEDRREIDALFDGVDAATDELERRAAGDAASVFAPDFDPYEPANRAARAYGLGVCGE